MMVAQGSPSSPPPVSRPSTSPSTLDAYLMSRVFTRLQRQQELFATGLNAKGYHEAKAQDTSPAGMACQNSAR
jgi:hypothetical protein